MEFYHCLHQARDIGHNHARAQLQRACDEGAKLTTLMEFTEVSPRQTALRGMLALAVLLAAACASERNRPTAPAGDAAPEPNQTETAPARGPSNGNPVLE